MNASNIHADEKVLILRKPVKLGDVEYSQLTLREPTAGELAKAENAAPTRADMAINLISIVAAVPRSAVERICQRDFEEASDFLGKFSEGDLMNGNEFSQA